MSSWLDFADMSDSFQEDETPFLGVFRMRPKDIASSLPRPETPFIRKPMANQNVITADSIESVCTNFNIDILRSRNPSELVC